MIDGREGVLIGIAVGGLNLWILSRVVAGLVHSESVPRWKTALFLFGKMGLIFVIIGLILWKGYVSPLPFVGGFTISLVGGLSILLLKTRTI